MNVRIYLSWQQWQRRKDIFQHPHEGIDLNSQNPLSRH